MPNDVPKKSKKQFGPKTGDPEKFETWEEFWNAWVNQIQFTIKHTSENYNLLEQLYFLSLGVTTKLGTLIIIIFGF